jgi:DNA-binding beta-propeller fold protein YncE
VHAAIAVAFVLVVAGCSRRATDPVSRAPELVVGSAGRGLGQFEFPRAVTVDAERGRFWVVDRAGRIQLFAAGGAAVCAWKVPLTENGAPVGLHVDRDGTLLVMDSHYQRILRYPPEGGEILASFGSKGKGPGQFTFGRDVIADSDGNIYAGDYGGDNDRIQKFTSEGVFVREWGSQGDAPGQFSKMQGMTIETIGGVEFILVADQCNHRVQRFDCDGNFVASFGTLGTGPGELRFPSGVAVDAAGDIYVSEWGNNRVQKFDTDGNSLGVWGGPGEDLGELKTPWDVEVGSDDRIYVVDYGNHRVQAFRWGDDASMTASRYDAGANEVAIPGGDAR